jgi:hypothetical protein
MTQTYCVSLARDIKPLLNERRLALSTIAEAKFSSIAAPNAVDWRERLWLDSVGSVRMTGTTRINWRNIPITLTTGVLNEIAFHENAGLRQVDFDLPFLKPTFLPSGGVMPSGPERSRARSVRRQRTLDGEDRSATLPLGRKVGRRALDCLLSDPTLFPKALFAQ